MNINLTDVPVYYINLDDQEQKRKQTESLLKQMGFKYVERFSAIRHDAGRIIGCARSHHAILSKDIKPPFIILEDDCALNKKFKPEVSIPDDADALYLGISHWGRYLNHSGPYTQYTKVNNQIVRVHNMLATHAIMYLTPEYVDICKRVAHHYGYEVENHLDIGFAEIHKLYNVYSYDEPIFRQYEWSSVTTGRLSEHAMDKKQADKFFERILTDDENYYKITGTPFKSPIRPLLTRSDTNGIHGYFLPTKLL